MKYQDNQVNTNKSTGLLPISPTRSNIFQRREFSYHRAKTPGPLLPQPDMSYGHREAHYPGVVVEVCYSTRANMPRTLQNEYILDTDIISDDWMLIDKYPFRTDSGVPVEGREGRGLILVWTDRLLLH